MIAVGIDVSKDLLDQGVHQEAKLQQYQNTPTGIARLVRRLRLRGEVRILVEATGGYEEAALAACAAGGLWICRVNPRQCCDFAKATGQLAKTDALDARILAEMMSVLSDPLRRLLERIHSLIKDISRSPFAGIGKPEPLKHALAGYCSRRINDEHRIVYKVAMAPY